MGAVFHGFEQRGAKAETGTALPIPFYKPSIGEDEISEVTDCLRSGWLTTGPKVKEFETEFSRYLHHRHAVALNSCTAALHLALEASELLASDGIDIEILDLRTLLPLDANAIKETVAKTSKVLILHEDNKTGGIGAEVAALIAEECFEELDGPIMRLAAADTHIPYAPALEEAILPNAEDVVAQLTL